MVLVDKKQVTISRKAWDILKKDKDYKELLEIIEETAELEKAKKESKYFIKLEDYLKQRDLKEKVKKIQPKRKRVSAQHK